MCPGAANYSLHPTLLSMIFLRLFSPCPHGFLVRRREVLVIADFRFSIADLDLLKRGNMWKRPSHENTV